MSEVRLPLVRKVVMSRWRVVTGVRYDTRGNFKPREFFGEPCPAVTVGVNSLNACHYTVSERTVGEAEMALWLIRTQLRRKSAKNGFRGETKRPVCLDHEPCPVVQAVGIGSEAIEQAYLEEDGPPTGPVRLLVPDGMTGKVAVAAWLEMNTGGAFTPETVLHDCDREPSPTVNAGGVGRGNLASHYWFLVDGREVIVTSEPTKPPYRVPPMAEVNTLPWNGFSAASSFSGCGGSSLGYRMAGFRVGWASEFIDAARDCYRANFPATYIDPRDVREVTPGDVLKACGLKEGELDVFDGSPPCASFSTSGKREAGWGKFKKYSDTVQRTDDLFFEYARLVKGIRPRVFVAENVSGLIKGTAKGYFLEILAALKACGYAVEARVLDAQWLGVPQQRQRVIFVGVRDDLAAAGIKPAFPDPLPYRYSVREAIPWITRQGDKGPFGGGAMRDAVVPSPTIGASPQTGNGDFPPSVVEAEAGAARITGRTGRGMERVESPLDEPMNAILASDANTRYQVTGPPGDGVSMEGYAIGAEWDKLKPGEKSDKYLNLVRADPDAPGSCDAASGGRPDLASVTHPTEKRKFTIAELRRICAFPDDFILLGTYEQQWERLGRAVPPLMMRAIAVTVRNHILIPARDRGLISDRR